MTEIENIKLFEFFRLPATVMLKQYSLLRCLKPKNEYGLLSSKEMRLRPYKDIVILKKLYKKQTPQALTKMVDGVFFLPVALQLEMDITTYFPLLNFILNGIEDIIKKEANSLNKEPKEELLAAGIELLNKYGEAVVIDQLAGGDMLKWEAIENKSWQWVFTKLCMEKDRAEIYENHSEIIKAKNKVEA